MIADQITIRVESTTEFVAFDDFVTVAESTVTLLSKIARQIADEGQADIEWRITDASLNSPLSMTISGEVADEDASLVGKAIEATTNGLRHLEEGSAGAPAYFGLPELDAAKRLVSPQANGVARITLVPTTGPILSPTQRISAQATALLPKPHYELGSIEGHLDSISVHKQRVFSIWDSISGDRVECRFPDELFIQAREALRCRVSVSGKIFFNRTGAPVSISVTEIRKLRDKSELPQFSDLEKMNLRSRPEPEELSMETRRAS